MFTIYNFEEHISNTIIKRGKDYYTTGCVTKVKETRRGNWEAMVKGSEKYEVAVLLKNNITVSNYDCDCPYDGDTCKHVVALLFYLKEKLTLDITPKKEPATKKPAAKKFTFETLIDSINLNEYKKFITDYAKSDKDFKTKFELYFSHKDNSFDAEKTYTDLITKLAKKHSHRGYMDYSSTKLFSKEINLIIKTAQEYFAKNNFRDALALTKTLIKETMEPLEYCDDSNGYLGDAISNSIELLTEMAAHTAVPYPVKEQMADFLNEELKNSQYFDYGDFGYDMVTVFFSVAKATGKQDAFITFLDKKAAYYKNESYNNDFFTTQKIGFLKAIGREDDALAITMQNMDITEIRREQVKKYLENGDYTTAKKLIHEGIAIAEEKKHPGTVYSWQIELFNIAVLEKDNVFVREHAKKLAFTHDFNKNYYNHWKRSYPKEGWPEVIENYIKEQITKITIDYKSLKGWRPAHPHFLGKLAPIYIEENYLDRLLELVKTETSFNGLFQFHGILLEKYPLELLDVYLPLLQKYATVANDRGNYQELASKMIKILADIPQSESKIKALAQKIMQENPRRRAMIEELNKV